MKSIFSTEGNTMLQHTHLQKRSKSATKHRIFGKRFSLLSLVLVIALMLSGQPAMVSAQSTCQPLCIANGNVGIGTATPALPLHVVAASNSVAVLQSTSPNSVLRLLNSGGETNFVQLGNLGGRFGVRTAGSVEALSVMPNGFVGIGTIAPALPLHVVAASNSVAVLQSTSPNSVLRLLNSGGENNFVQLGNLGGRFGVRTAAGGEAFNVMPNGLVGIGTTAPNATLDVNGNFAIANTFPAGSPGLPTLNVSQQAGGVVGRLVSSGTSASLLLKDGTANNDGVQLRNQGGNFSVLVNGGTPVLNVSSGGYVGIGTLAPQALLDVAGSVSVAGSTFSTDAGGNLNLRPSHIDGNVFIRDGNSEAGIRFYGGGNNRIQSVSTDGVSTLPLVLQPEGGIVRLGEDSPDFPNVDLNVNGTTTTDILVIDGGADLAEPFEINGAETIEPGMVVAIDPANPGQLRLADAAYDRTVAGVVSGAGGINPGLILQQEGTIAAGGHPVALSGRVYVYADASNGAIQPGDLLTTSDMLGHAMKVTDHDLAQGAILGKAMTTLDEGTGLVLLLVTLQ